MRHAEHGTFDDAIVFAEGILDLARIDVLAAANDNLLEAAVLRSRPSSSIIPRSPERRWPSVS
jgi:hypothetical protein